MVERVLGFQEEIILLVLRNTISICLTVNEFINSNPSVLLKRKPVDDSHTLGSLDVAQETEVIIESLVVPFERVEVMALQQCDLVTVLRLLQILLHLKKSYEINML